MKLPIKILIAILFWCLTLFGCSNGGLSVEETKWNCQTKNSIQICNVEFTLKNSSELPVSATVVIRALQRGFSRFGANPNVKIPEKRLSFVIGPGETKEFQETFKGVGRVRQIVVTAYGEKVSS